MKHIRTCFSALLAGIAISVSGVAYLSAAQQSQLVAALLFSVGFLTVLLFELHLFTDRIGYLFTGGGKLKKRLASILFVLLGNILGAIVFSALYALKKDDEKGGSHSSRRHHHHHEH